MEMEAAMTKSLRERLVGAWKLASYQELPVDGVDPVEPLGHHPEGIILYTPDGYMSAHIARPDRPAFVSEDWFAGTLAEYQAEATSYIAYSGPFHVNEEAGTVTHEVFVSLFPNWSGSTQTRRVELEGDTLRLSTASPIHSGGRTVTARATWHRAPPH